MKIATIGTTLPPREDRTWVTSSELTIDAGITYRQLDYWCRTGLLAPMDDATPGTGWTRRFAEHQVDRAHLLHGLLDAGFSLQSCRQLSDDLPAARRVDVGPFTLTIRPGQEGHTAA